MISILPYPQYQFKKFSLSFVMIKRPLPKEESNSDQEQESTKLLNSKDLVVRPPTPVKSSNKFSFTTFELVVCAILGVSQHVYHIGMIGKKTRDIQAQHPMKNVVPSWFGLYRDDSDGQWREFRENLPAFLWGMTMFVVLNRMIKSKLQNQPKERMNMVTLFYLVTGFLFLTFLFRSGVLVWIAFTGASYALQHFLYKFKYFPIVLWATSVWQLYYIYYYRNQPLEFVQMLFPTLGEFLLQENRQAVVPWGMIYPITLLRVMSFSLDKHWAETQKYKFDLKVHEEKCSTCAQRKTCYRARSEQYLDVRHYKSLTNYYAYLAYAPLFITGPQITYNAFISQMEQPQNIYSNYKIFIYLVRALNNILILEIYTHLHFASALAKVEANREYWINFTLTECFFMGFSNLVFIWLKFLTIWRLARAFSLLDGFDVPENMNRCIYNNYCFEGFWRSWHRGFNQWLIRYLFIPIGGSKTKVWNIWVIFTFVAIWHDFTLDLVLWAWFICFALIPEMLAKNWAHRQKTLWSKCWFKYFCAFFAALYIWLMVFANLIGFGNGWQNMEIIFLKVLQPGSIYQLFTAMLAMYFFPILQFWIRSKEQEALGGKDQGF